MPEPGDESKKKPRAIRVSDEDWDRIGALASEAGVTRTSLLLEAALGTEIRYRLHQPTRDAIHRLDRIGLKLERLQERAEIRTAEIDSVLDELRLWVREHMATPEDVN